MSTIQYRRYTLGNTAKLYVLADRQIVLIWICRYFWQDENAEDKAMLLESYVTYPHISPTESIGIHNQDWKSAPQLNVGIPFSQSPRGGWGW